MNGVRTVAAFLFWLAWIELVVGILFVFATPIVAALRFLGIPSGFELLQVSLGLFFAWGLLTALAEIHHLIERALTDSNLVRRSISTLSSAPLSEPTASTRSSTRRTLERNQRVVRDDNVPVFAEPRLGATVVDNLRRGEYLEDVSPTVIEDTSGGPLRYLMVTTPRGERGFVHELNVE